MASISSVREVLKLFRIEPEPSLSERDVDCSLWGTSVHIVYKNPGFANVVDVFDVDFQVVDALFPRAW